MFRACSAQSSRVIASSSSRASSLHTSAVAHAQKSRQDVARGIRKLNVIKNEELQKTRQENRPSVVLGIRPGQEKKWNDCKLAKVLVDVETLVSSTARVETQQPVGTVHLPQQTSFGIGEAETKLLFGTLPLLTSTHGGQYNHFQGASEHVSTDEIKHSNAQWIKKVKEENSKANNFAAVIDLRNANADGIAFENRRRIIEAFSTPQNPFDPGRSEVQAALLTYKIRNLWNHLTTFKRDLGNRRGLRMLVHQRAKVLKYLKKVDPARYAIVLEQLALEPESVEGELVV